MPDFKDLVVHLAGIHINNRPHSRARSRAVDVSGHLISSVLKEKWVHLSEQQQQRLIRASTNRLWNSYMTKRRNFGLSTEEAAEEAISEELAVLKQLFDSN